MTNAKAEMLGLLKCREIKCAKVITLGRWDETKGDWDENHEGRTIILKVGHDEEDYAKFLNDLDFEYDSGYGGQELFGTVWFKDDTWAERGEYDGSEWWEINSLPDIPKNLLP